MADVHETPLAPLVERIARSGVSFDTERLTRAYSVAAEAYEGRRHWTGISLLDHVVGVLEILAPFQPDEDAVIATLLQNVLHTKTLSLFEIEEEFGSNVRSLVSGVHLLSHVTLDSRRRSIEDLRLMLLSVSEDLRVVLIALSERAHCLKFLHAVSRTKARQFSQDILQLYAPVAARLGIYSLKHHLETGAFPVIYPDDAARVVEQIDRIHQEYPDFLEQAASQLSTFLREHNIKASVHAREKQPYSTFLKMQRKGVSSVRDLPDLFAIRVIVGSEEECYSVLGLLHRVGRPVTNRFKDYIAFPKPNGYQSLHTTLAGMAGVPEGILMEVQIRTERMHREAEYGIAAHWSYKETGATRRALEKVQLHSMLLGQQSLDDGEVEDAGLADHIFVLTPKGDIVELPEGATPLDFAFQVHTELGLSFRAARVNGVIVSLEHQLENGDIVEVLKHSSPQPAAKWMQLLKMASSRAKLKRHLYAQQRPQHVARGRELVNAELRKRNLPPLTTDLSLLRICDGKKLPQQEREDILMKIGQGSERAAVLLPRLEALQKHFEPSQKKKARTTAPAEAANQSAKPAIFVEGGVPLPTRFAQCCHPEEDGNGAIAGNVNGRGEVMVHRADCRRYLQTNPERRVGVFWSAPEKCRM